MFVTGQDPKQEEVALPAAGFWSGIKVTVSPVAFVETASGDPACVGVAKCGTKLK